MGTGAASPSGTTSMLGLLGLFNHLTMKGNTLITLLCIAIAYFTLVFIGASPITAGLCILIGLLGRTFIRKYMN